MNDLEAIPDEEAPLEILHVFLSDGSRLPINAASYRLQSSPEDRIEFLKPDGTPDDQIFLRAQFVACIVPESSLGRSRSFTELSDRVRDIDLRVQRLEKLAKTDEQA